MCCRRARDLVLLSVLLKEDNLRANFRRRYLKEMSRRLSYFSKKTKIGKSVGSTWCSHVCSIIIFLQLTKQHFRGSSCAVRENFRVVIDFILFCRWFDNSFLLFWIFILYTSSPILLQRISFSTYTYTKIVVLMRFGEALDAFQHIFFFSIVLSIFFSFPFSRMMAAK